VDTAAATSDRRRRRVVVVSRVKRNPYVELLREGLSQPDLGLEVREVDHFSVGWVWRHRREIDVLHIHWLELLFVYPGLAWSLKRWLSVMAGLLVARLAGIRLVYTLHNITQHEGRRPLLARLGHRVMFALAHAIHVHDEQVAVALREQWRRRRGVHVIPHGNYVGAYPNLVTRDEARRKLGLAASDFVYLFLGRVRPYKGIEELLAAFRALPDGDAVLCVAGEVQDPGYEQSLQELAGGDGRIRLHLEFVADEELQVFFNACDICALPYRHVTTSGAALLSFSFGVPIVAPRIGCLAELVGEEERGVSYDPDLPGGLLDALKRCRRADLDALRQASMAYAARLNWHDIAKQHAGMYQQGGQHV
jgi:glycosyltransferase involved in cell wall biosynthesis